MFTLVPIKNRSRAPYSGTKCERSLIPGSSRFILSAITFEAIFASTFKREIGLQFFRSQHCIGSCRCLSIRDIILGILKERMDLINYIVILGKTYLWTCRCKGINPNFNHFKIILEIKYETEKYIAFKQLRSASLKGNGKYLSYLI